MRSSATLWIHDSRLDPMFQHALSDAFLKAVDGIRNLSDLNG